MKVYLVTLNSVLQNVEVEHFIGDDVDCGPAVCESREGAQHIIDNVLKNPEMTIIEVDDLSPYFSDWRANGQGWFEFDDDFRLSWNHFEINDGDQERLNPP